MLLNASATESTNIVFNSARYTLFGFVITRISLYGLNCSRCYYIFTKIPLCCLPCCISLCRSDYIFRASALHTFSTHLSVRQRHKSMTDWQIRCYEVYERCLGHLPLCYESNLRTFSPPLFHIVNNTCHSTSSGRTIHHIYR